MAKKLKKFRTSPMRLFIEILIPWVVMAIVAVGMYELDIRNNVVILAALAVALATTFLIREYERRRRRLSKP